MDIDLTTFLILILATWRISSLLVDENGPYDVFGKLRWRVGVRYDEHSVPYGTTELSALFSCVWCMSVWVGAGVVLAYALFSGLTVWLLLPFALSAAAILIQRVLP